MKDVQFVLGDIVMAIEAVSGFVGTLSEKEFLTDDKTSSAVIRKLEIIGEATKKIPESVRGEFPSIPWKEMAAMRDILIHQYNEVDLGIVWQVVVKRLPGIHA